MIEIEPVGNQLFLDEIGNQVSLQLFDVFTDHYYLSQFQIMQEHGEVLHANSN